MFYKSTFVLLILASLATCDVLASGNGKKNAIAMTDDEVRQKSIERGYKPAVNAKDREMRERHLHKLVVGRTAESHEIVAHKKVLHQRWVNGEISAEEKEKRPDLLPHLQAISSRMATKKAALPPNIWTGMR